MKKVIITVIFVLMFVMNISSTSFAGDTYTTGFGIISGDIEYNTSVCKEEYPLYVRFYNRSVRTVGGINFALLARHQSRSTNLITSGYWTTKNGYRKNTGWYSDKIINRFEEASMCFKLPTLSENTNPGQLVWEIEITNVNWK